MRDTEQSVINAIIAQFNMRNRIPSPNLSRREFIARTAASAAGVTLAGSLAGCATTSVKHAKIPVGLQLYSLRNECRADFPGTIAAVGKIGYRGVEFAGYWNYSAKDIRKMLDDSGLVACGTHTPYETILPDQLEQTIEFNRILGNKFLIVPWMTGKTRQEWLDKAAMFNDVAAKLKPHGMWTGYHAHAHDFNLIEGESAWDIFFGQTRPEVVMQLDTCNCREGHADPIVVLRRYPGRGRTIHIKPNGGGPESVIGEDSINWPGVFECCETTAGTQWYVVEHETSKTPLATVRRTYEVLKKLGKV